LKLIFEKLADVTRY